MASEPKNAAKKRSSYFGNRFWSGLRSMPRSHSYPLILGVLALVVPAGLLITEAVEADQTKNWMISQKEIIPFPMTYVFLTICTVTALIVLGFFIGRWFDRAHLQAITDPLTGLYNRRHFSERLAEEVKRSSRYGTDTCVLSVDLDQLKIINDQLGHKLGDHAIMAVAESLAQVTRDTDVVARVGGDEFAVLLPETTGSETEALVARILDAVSKKQNAWIKRLTVSIGIAQVPRTVGMETFDVLDAADFALYQAKAAGGGLAVMAKPAVHLKTPISSASV